jgi:hypothetical protein
MATASGEAGGRGRRGAAEEDAVAAEEGRPRRGSRRRGVAARGAGAVGSLMLMIARLVRLVVALVVLLIVAAILLRVLDANASNTIVKDVHDASKTLVGPFHNLFSIHDAKLAIGVNWGIAALVWLVVGGLIARTIARIAPRGGLA